MPQPNILFIQVDQLTALALRQYGDPICHTPNLDTLADTGVIFDTAYCNFPLCAPSRFSMATGRLCSAIDAFDNAAEMPASLPTYAHYLKATGYQTVLSGKMHFIGPDQYHGFEQRLTGDLYPADFAWVPNWGNEGKRDTNDARGVLISGICEHSVQLAFDERVAFQAVQFLYDRARSGESRPFFLQVSFTHPHEPYLCRKKYWDLYADDQIPAPVVGAMPADQHDAHAKRLLKDFSMLDKQFAEHEIQRARHAYYGSISYVDELIGNVIDALKASGESENTVIIFTSDHGDMLGERGLWFKKHFYEPSLRVPLIISAPHLDPKHVATPVSLVDLLPTFMSFADQPGWSKAVDSLDGSDLLSLIDSPEDTERPIYAEYLAEATLAPIFMIRKGRYKYTSSKTDKPLLFDLQSDPHETDNLAGKQAHLPVVERFQAEVNEKWDSDAIEQRIHDSQQRRLLIKGSTTQTEESNWSHSPASPDEHLWYRGQGSYNDWAFSYLPRK